MPAAPPTPVPGHPQPGIFALGTRAHHHLQLDVVGDPSALRPAIAELRKDASAVRGVNVVVGFGRRVWEALSPGSVPEELADFSPITGQDGFTVPADQHDVWLWLHSAGPDAVFDVARQATHHLAGVAVVVTEQPSFMYQASQDLTGFEDGTENPPLDEAVEVATIPGGRAAAGGSMALVQRWVHDLDGFERLPVAEREDVFGRTLHGSVQLDEDRLPRDSHVARVVIVDDEGEELQIFRRSSAFGGVREHGLQFVAFAADRSRMQRMLERMAGVGDGQRDRLTRYSAPTASAWYLVPPVELLHAGT
jgi:putative iron-dependent peroxidase